MKDIYTITPELEIKLTHALNLLEEVITDNELQGTPVDKRIEEAANILKDLPFFPF